MVTIVTDVELKEGAERKWDAIMRERMTEPGSSGAVGAASPLRGRSHKRVIVGTGRPAPTGSTGTKTPSLPARDSSSTSW
jgi:hypothetical protein